MTFKYIIFQMKKNPWVADKLENLISDIDTKKITDEKYIKESLERFKHERIVHLFVTIFIWILLAIFFVNSANSIFFCIILDFTIISKWAYLYHYYRLENWVQKLNQQYLNIISKAKKSTK